MEELDQPAPTHKTDTPIWIKIPAGGRERHSELERGEVLRITKEHKIDCRRLATGDGPAECLYRLADVLKAVRKEKDAADDTKSAAKAQKPEEAQV